MNQIDELRRRLLRVPLFQKILFANSAIVLIGAVVGTVTTIWHVQTYPQDIHYELILLFTIAGIIGSFAVNNWVLKRALAPLDRVQDAVDEVRSGATNVRVDPGPMSDERFDRLADTFNQMLQQLETNAMQLRQLPRQILQVQETERHRLARDLHDEAAQALTSLLVHLRLLERAHTPEDAQARVQELRQLTAQALEEVRRVALDLRPTILDDLGLEAALAWRVDEFNKLEGLTATITTYGWEARLPRDVELVLYRVGQEALNNVTRHAHATRVEVTLMRRAGSVRLAVADNGQGFDPAAPRFADVISEDGERHDSDHGFGLLGMRERLGMIGGTLEIRSLPGQGTEIVAVLSKEITQ